MKTVLTVFAALVLLVVGASVFDTYLLARPGTAGGAEIVGKLHRDRGWFLPDRYQVIVDMGSQEVVANTSKEDWQRLQNGQNVRVAMREGFFTRRLRGWGIVPVDTP